MPYVILNAALAAGAGSISLVRNVLLDVVIGWIDMSTGCCQPTAADCCFRLSAALIQTRPDGMDVVPMEQQLPGQRDLAAGTTRRATAAWWQDGHPGWMIFTLGGTHFDSLEQVIQVHCWCQLLLSCHCQSELVTFKAQG
jgi:hypothetical protein